MNMHAMEKEMVAELLKFEGESHLLCTVVFWIPNQRYRERWKSYKSKTE
jgi:hypothetical protein